MHECKLFECKRTRPHSCSHPSCQPYPDDHHSFKSVPTVYYPRSPSLMFEATGRILTVAIFNSDSCDRQARSLHLLILPHPRPPLAVCRCGPRSVTRGSEVRPRQPTRKGTQPQARTIVLHPAARLRVLRWRRPALQERP